MLLAALMVPVQRWTAQVSGRILDRDGKPLVNAQITYTHVGQYTNGGAMTEGPAIMYEAGHPRISDGGTGRIYKAKTDKKGEFILIGLAYGVYVIEIADSSGKRVYSTKRLVGDNVDRNISNILNVNLSTALPGQPAGGTNLASDKKNKEQLALVREENANASKINRLILELRSALDAQDWTKGVDLLQQLLALDPNRWEVYQNLGTIENNLSHYQEAVQAFQKGVAVAEKTLANAPDQAQAKTAISGMMIAEGDAYLRMDKLEAAVALYNQASAIAPSPGMAYLRACNAQANRGAAEAAIDACNRAIAADPDQWDSYQVLGGIENASGKSQDALATYQRGVQAARKELASNPASARAKNGMGQMLNAEGNLYSKSARYDEAIEAFAESAKLSAYAALPYFNLCATYYNVKRLQEAVAACDQALASDPTMADAYYIKACALFGKGSLEQGRYTSPPETRATLNKYLEFAPFGQYAQAVREMLDKLDSTDDASHKTRKPAAK